MQQKPAASQPGARLRRPNTSGDVSYFVILAVDFYFFKIIFTIFDKIGHFSNFYMNFRSFFTRKYNRNRRQGAPVPLTGSLTGYAKRRVSRQKPSFRMRRDQPFTRLYSEAQPSTNAVSTADQSPVPAA